MRRAHVFNHFVLNVLFSGGNYLIGECYNMYIVRMFSNAYVHCAVELYYSTSDNSDNSHTLVYV